MRFKLNIRIEGVGTTIFKINYGLNKWILDAYFVLKLEHNLIFFYRMELDLFNYQDDIIDALEHMF